MVWCYNFKTLNGEDKAEGMKRSKSIEDATTACVLWDQRPVGNFLVEIMKAETMKYLADLNVRGCPPVGIGG